MKKLITKYILIILGLILFLGFIWLRFIRIRLPRDIPFELSLLGFIFLLYICSIYIYIIISMLFNYKTDSKVLSTLISYIYKPFITLDEAIKTNAIIKPYYEKFLVYIITITKDKDLHKEGTFYLYLYIIMQIIPRVILVSALLLDTFYFHCLFLLYKVIIVSLLIFLSRYIRYSLTYAKEQYILELESMVDCILSNYTDPDKYELGSGSALPVRRFIEEQTSILGNGLAGYTYGPLTSNKYRDNFRKLHNLSPTHRFTSKEIALINVDFYRIMKIVIPISVHLEEYGFAETYSRCKLVKMIIFTLYLICWSYILIVSANSLSIDTCNFLFQIIDNTDPFSGHEIEY